MEININELYAVLGDNAGVRFLCDELPGVVVTVGFTLQEKENDEDVERSNDGSTGAAESGEPGRDAAPAVGHRRLLH